MTDGLPTYSLRSESDTILVTCPVCHFRLEVDGAETADEAKEQASLAHRHIEKDEGAYCDGGQLYLEARSLSA